MSHDLFMELSRTYGPVYTVWVGMKPMVILASNKVIREALQDSKNEFAGRPSTNFRDTFLVRTGSSDVLFEDWGRTWEVLRRVSHSAVRKVALNPSFPGLAVSVVDQVADLIIREEGLNHPFDPRNYVYLMVYSIIAATAAGKSYSINDEEFLKLKSVNHYLNEIISDLVVVEYIPFLKLVPPYRQKWLKSNEYARVQLDWCAEQMQTHHDTYQNGRIRDFCDSLIFAKKEAEAADVGAVDQLNDENLCNVINNLFQAGTETTITTLMWILLFLANYPDVQSKVRAEIEEVIGDEIPTNDHKLKCNYVQAFICEVMRFKPINPMAVPHKTIADCAVDGHALMAGTTVLPLLYAALHDGKVWGDPEVFRPERFLDPLTGAHTTRLNNAFIPFSVGRRACLGDKLTLISLFIQITRLLQKIKGMRIVLERGPGSVSMDPDPNLPTSIAAKDFKVMIVGH